jgi:phenylacetate-CoA ligase
MRGAFLKTIKSTREGLEAIETASADELRAVQLEPLERTLHHAHDNIAHYRRSFAAAG